MIKRRLPLTIHFDFECEYSKDNGVSWSTLAADTLIEIPEAEIHESGIVKIRSTENVTSIDTEKLGLKRRLFDSVNFKNCKTLTSLNNLLSYTTIDRIRVANVDNVVDADFAFFRSTSKSLYIDYLPNANTLRNMFSYARSNIVSNVIFGKKDILTQSIHEIFKNANINILGDFRYKGKAIANAFRMFAYSNINMFPYIDLTFSNNDDNEHTDYRQSALFHAIKSKYMLEGVLRVDDGDISTDAANNNKRFMAEGNYTHASFYDTSLHFTGLSIILNKYGVADASYISEQMWQHSKDMKFPFKLFVNHGYDFILDGAVDDATSDTQIGTVLPIDVLRRLEKEYGYLSTPNWFEDLTILEDFTNTDLIGVTSLLVKDFQLEIIKDDYSQKSLDKATKYTDEFDVATLHGRTCSQIYGARSGIRVERNGTTFSVYNPNKSLISTFVDDTENIVSGYVNEDGTTIFLVIAQQYDTVNGGEQQLSAALRVYNALDGSFVMEKQLTLPSSSQLIGIWEPTIESNTQLIMRQWQDDGEGTWVEVNSIVQAQKNDLVLSTQRLSHVAHIVGPNYCEDNEFVCINSETGEGSRCLGK